MPIQADVGQLERLARKVRNYSQTVARETRKINDNIAGIVWKGKAHDRFQTEFRPTQQKMTQAARDLDEFAARLERIAEAFRQADMAEDRRREAEARARREQEIAVRAASRSRK